MKGKLILISLLFLVMCSTVKAQSVRLISQLSDLCKAWGNLKYFHPEVAIGRHNWDSVLVSAAGRMLNNSSQNSFQHEIDLMLQIAGKNNAAVFIIDKSAHPYTYRNIDHSWLDKSSNISASQKEALQYNYSHPAQAPNYYAQNNPNDDGNIITPNEKPYPEMKMPDVNYRLLGLFRFWNVINYYYPYKYGTATPWDKVLSELIPAFINAGDTLSYHKAVLRMAASIDDGHGGVYPFIDITVAGKYSPPFFFHVIDNKAVITKILDEEEARKANIQRGSVIEKINGLPVKKRAEKLWNYIPASNTTGKYRDLHKLILNSKDALALYSGYNPDGTKFSSNIKLSERNFLAEFLDFYGMTSPITSAMITNDIAYIYASNINRNNMDSIMQPLLKTRAIILDLRNYPNTMNPYKIIEYFLDKPTVYSKQTRNNFNYPGLLVYENTNAGTTVEMVGKANNNPYTGKLILLVDYRTQSLPEFDCLIFKTFKNTIIVGNQTAGADGNQTRMMFPGGYRISFSGFGIYEANGKEAQHAGIPIDIPVKYTITDIVHQRDAVLEKAIEYAKSN
ncbi:MAG: S41 family peptidase [Chitinophagaceae bacterium]